MNAKPFIKRSRYSAINKRVVNIHVMWADFVSSLFFRSAHIVLSYPSKSLSFPCHCILPFAVQKTASTTA